MIPKRQLVILFFVLSATVAHAQEAFERIYTVSDLFNSQLVLTSVAATPSDEYIVAGYNNNDFNSYTLGNIGSAESVHSINLYLTTGNWIFSSSNGSVFSINDNFGKGFIFYKYGRSGIPDTVLQYRKDSGDPYGAAYNEHQNMIGFLSKTSSPDDQTTLSLIDTQGRLLGSYRMYGADTSDLTLIATCGAGFALFGNSPHSTGINAVKISRTGATVWASFDSIPFVTSLQSATGLSDGGCAVSGIVPGSVFPNQNLPMIAAFDSQGALKWDRAVTSIYNANGCYITTEPNGTIVMAANVTFGDSPASEAHDSILLIALNNDGTVLHSRLLAIPNTSARVTAITTGTDGGVFMTGQEYNDSLDHSGSNGITYHPFVFRVDSALNGCYVQDYSVAMAPIGRQGTSAFAFEVDTSVHGPFGASAAGLPDTVSFSASNLCLSGVETPVQPQSHEFTITPNPFTNVGELSISTAAGAAGIYDIRLSDEAGRPVATTRQYIGSGATELRLPYRAVAAGVYYLEVRSIDKQALAQTLTLIKK